VGRARQLVGFLLSLAPTVRGGARRARSELLPGLAILLAGAEVLVQGVGHDAEHAVCAALRRIRQLTVLKLHIARRHRLCGVRMLLQCC
jgi:hypothetical protein